MADINNPIGNVSPELWDIVINGKTVPDYLKDEWDKVKNNPSIKAISSVINSEADKEHQDSLRKFKSVTDHYKNTYSDRSLEIAKAKSSREKQFIGFGPDAPTNSDYIEQTRALYYKNLKAEEKKTQNDIDAKYDTDTKNINSKLAGLLDKPVSIGQGIAKDFAISAGRQQGEYTDGISKVFGKDSKLDKFIDSSKEKIGIADAVVADIKKLSVDNPFIDKKLKKLKDIGADVNPEEALGHWGQFAKIWSVGARGSLFEFADILSEWWHDPKTLCCFIKNMAALGSSLNETYNGGEWELGSDVRSFLDKMIALLKITRNFLNMDIPFDVMLGIDLGLMMSKASTAALMATLASLQDMLENAIYEKLLEYAQSVDDKVRACLPFERLFALLSDILSGPDGMFDWLEELINSYLTGLSAGLNHGYHTGLKQKLIDVTAIDKLIDIIESIRDAVLNLELCIEADFIENDHNDSSTLTRDENEGGSNANNAGIAGSSLLGRDYNDLGKKIQKQVVFPTDSEIKAFITTRLGESNDFADQVIEYAQRSDRSSTDGQLLGAGDNEINNIDKFTSAIGDCARTLNPDKIAEMANLISDWDLGI